jgi:hypothetical protein
MAIRTSIALAILFSLAACSTTKLTDSWQQAEFKRSDMKKVLVVAAASNTNNRFLFETGFVAALTEQGVDATASFTAIGDALPSKEAVEEHLKSVHYDHIIVTSMSNVDIETDYVPESVRTYYTGPYYPRWGGYWGAGNSITMTREAYTDTQINVILSTSIYNTDNQQLAWVGRSKTFEVNSVSALADSLARQMVKKIKN